MKGIVFILLFSLIGKFTLAIDADTSYRVWINDRLDESYDYSFSQFEESIRIAKIALDSSLYYSDSVLTRDAYSLIGDTYGWFAHYDSGNYYLNLALELSKALKDTGEIIYIQSMMGLNCINSGDYHCGIQHLIEAENLSLHSGNTENLGWIYYYMTLAYHDQENFVRKVKRLNDALHVFNENDQPQGILSASADLLVYYLDQNERDSIEKYHSIFTASYKRQVDELDLSFLSYCLYTQAYYQYRSKNYSASEKLYLQAIAYADSTSDYFSKVSYNLDYLTLLLETNRIEDAWSVVSEAVEASEQINSMYLRREVAYGLSDYYARVGKWESAYDAIRKAQNLNDTITQNRIDIIDLNDDIKSLEDREEQLKLKQQILQKESDIRLLILVSVFLLVLVLALTMGYVVRNNQKYKRLNKSLVESQQRVENQKQEIEKSRKKISEQHELVQNAYETQGKIMSIVGHDLRTPLAQIKNILELERSGALSPVEKTEIFKELERTTVASLEMLSSLVNWGKAKLQSDGSTATSTDVLRMITEECFELYSTALTQKNIQISFIEKHAFELPVSEAESAVIIRNIVYNSIKFSNQNGEVQVEVRLENHKPTLLIRDFGVGMSPDQVHRLTEGLNIESIRGTGNEGGFGLGMWFVRDITLRNHGTFTIESSPNNGSEFKIQFNSTGQK